MQEEGQFSYLKAREHLDVKDIGGYKMLKGNLEKLWKRRIQDEDERCFMVR